MRAGDVVHIPANARKRTWDEYVRGVCAKLGWNYDEVRRR
jgi:hypothetical protein